MLQEKPLVQALLCSSVSYHISVLVLLLLSISIIVERHPALTEPSAATRGGHLIPAQPFHPLIQVNAPKKCCAYPYCITTLQTVLPGDVSVPADLILAAAAVATIKFLVSLY